MTTDLKECREQFEAWATEQWQNSAPPHNAWLGWEACWNARPTAAPDEKLADEVENGRKLLAVYDGLINCRASLRAVLPLLEAVQAHCPPGDHDVTIARAKHNLDVLDKEIVKQDTPAILAALRQPSAAAWRPIESAPKDGTELIGFRPDQGTFVFRWATMEELVPKDMHGDPIEDYDEDFADWWHDRWQWMEGELAPTHWQPLPAPPAEEAM